MDTEEHKPKHKGGRTPIDIDLARVEGLAARGNTLEDIAYGLGIAPSTLYAKKRLMVEISEAVKRGRAKGTIQVSSSLFDAAVQGSFPHQAFYLERRCGWTKPSESETPSETIRRGGLGSDLVGLLRQSLLGQLQPAQSVDERSIEVQPVRQEVQPVRHEPLTIDDKRAELLGRNGKNGSDSDS